MKRIVYFLFITILFSSCYAVRAYRFRKFEYKDLDKFRVTTIKKSTRPFHFEYAQRDHSTLTSYLDSNLQNSSTYAFLVIQDDSILYEKYFAPIDSAAILPSFSVVKSFVSTLAQIAHQEGKIKSFADPVTEYLPWLLKSDSRWQYVTVQHVLDMRTGVKSSETYDSPFSDVIRLGFTRNVSNRLQKPILDTLPGKFIYKSVNTQILASVIEAAIGQKLQDYLYEKLWLPLGMESDATWHIDAKGTVRAFCCLNATLKDYAKIGRLYLRNGNWEGAQLLSPQWVQTILNADTMRIYQGYKNHWWSSRTIKRFQAAEEALEFIQTNPDWYYTETIRNGKVYYNANKNLKGIFAQGMLGQFLYVNPQKRLIIVRLGHNWSHPRYYAQKFIEELAEMID